MCFCKTVSLITTGAIWVSDIATSGGYLNMTPGQRERYESLQCTPESLEREKLLSECTSDFSADSLMQPQSDISIRNRYLSRIGAMVKLNLPIYLFYLFFDFPCAITHYRNIKNHNFNLI